MTTSEEQNRLTCPECDGEGTCGTDACCDCPTCCGSGTILITFDDD